MGVQSGLGWLDRFRGLKPKSGLDLSPLVAEYALVPGWETERPVQRSQRPVTQLTC